MLHSSQVNTSLSPTNGSESSVHYGTGSMEGHVSQDVLHISGLSICSQVFTEATKEPALTYSFGRITLQRHVAVRSLLVYPPTLGFSQVVPTLSM
ncbi:hypothetical protein DFH29DRAFT_933180 [Suillus ampliporus]|nr:hypothetical protein DFH29DRAFT_933180 [Suillus ampliporus]